MGADVQVDKWEDNRQSLGLPSGITGDPELEALASASSPTGAQMQSFIRACAQRYRQKTIDPGEPALGAVLSVSDFVRHIF